MDKTSLQKRFRFIMVIAALAMLVTIVTPAYIHYGENKQHYPRVAMMWTVLFGKGVKNQFSISWFAFAGYISIIVVLIIALLRKFIVINTENTDNLESKNDKDKKKNKKKTNKSSVILDAVSLVFVIISLVMFILLPILITETSCTNEYLIHTFYSWGFAYILIYLCLAVMIATCLMSIYVDVVVAVINKFKKNKQAKVVNAKSNGEAKEEIKEETKEEATTTEVKEDTKE